MLRKEKLHWKRIRAAELRDREERSNDRIEFLQNKTFFAPDWRPRGKDRVLTSSFKEAQTKAQPALGGYFSHTLEQEKIFFNRIDYVNKHRRSHDENCPDCGCLEGTV